MSTRFTQEHLDRLNRGERRPGTERLSAAEAKRLFSGAPLPAPEYTGNKMRNEPTVYEGRRYDSKAEAGYARKLNLLQLAGEVAEWKPQVKYELTVAGVHITKYILDFWVRYTDGHEEYIDVKGQRSGGPYKLFKCKRNLMLAVHGIVVQEVKG